MEQSREKSAVTEFSITNILHNVKRPTITSGVTTVTYIHDIRGIPAHRSPVLIAQNNYEPKNCITAGKQTSFEHCGLVQSQGLKIG